VLGDEPRHGGAEDQEDNEARHLHRHHKGDVDIAGCRDDCHGPQTPLIMTGLDRSCNRLLAKSFPGEVLGH